MSAICSSVFATRDAIASCATNQTPASPTTIAAVAPSSAGAADSRNSRRSRAWSASQWINAPPRSRASRRVHEREVLRGTVIARKRTAISPPKAGVWKKSRPPPHCA